MALTYIFITSPFANAVTQGGKLYTANATGFITGVLPLDAQTLNGTAGAPLQLLAATGATADRPNIVPATPLTGVTNNIAPLPTLAMAFWDTTLSKTAYFVGTQRSSTGWVDFSSAAI